MRYIKDNVITSNPTFKNVVNPSHDYIISQGWVVYEEPELTLYEVAMQDWHEPNYALRIRAPKSLALEYPQMYVWFQINDLPIHKVGDEALLYCNEILKEHQPLVDNLDSVTVVNRPNPADYE